MLTKYREPSVFNLCDNDILNVFSQPIALTLL